MLQTACIRQPGRRHRPPLAAAVIEDTLQVLRERPHLHTANDLPLRPVEQVSLRRFFEFLADERHAPRQHPPEISRRLY